VQGHIPWRNDGEDTGNNDYINNKYCVAYLFIFDANQIAHYGHMCMSLSLSESKDEDNNYKKQKSP